MSDTPLLDVRGLTTHYVSARGTRVTRAVEDVSFTLRDGETLGIVGESGSGKTTLALSLLRLLPPAARTIGGDRKSTRLNSSHVEISYAVFCLKKKKSYTRTSTS